MKKRSEARNAAIFFEYYGFLSERIGSLETKTVKEVQLLRQKAYDGVDRESEEYQTLKQECVKDLRVLERLRSVRRQRDVQVEEALGKINQANAYLLRYLYIERMTHSEIAKMLDMSERTIGRDKLIALNEIQIGNEVFI